MLNFMMFMHAFMCNLNRYAMAGGWCGGVSCDSVNGGNVGAYNGTVFCEGSTVYLRLGT